MFQNVRGISQHYIREENAETQEKTFKTQGKTQASEGVHRA